MTTYFYRAFGLTIESQCECPELIPIGEQIISDVIVCWGKVPEHLETSIVKNNWIEGESQKMLMTISGVARYLVEQGRQITIQVCREAMPESVRLYLLGSAMGAMLHQRGLLPFHGSSICSGGQAITFSGPSGVGKSTLAAALVERGYRLLADDVSTISFIEEVAFVNPGMPQIKLCGDAMEQLGRDKTQVRQLTNHVEKYGCPVHSSFVTEAFPSRMIYILGRSITNRFEDIPLKGMDKFSALRNNTYRPSFVKAMGIEQIHFTLLRKLAAQVDVHILLRPADGFQIKELADYVALKIASNS